MKRYLLSLCFILLSFIGIAQYITHGPVTGAVTENSCRIYIRTDISRDFTLEYSTDSLFTSFQTIAARTDSSIDNIKIVNINGLMPSTQYFMRFVFDGTIDLLHGSFKTFPPIGSSQHLLFVTGSCQETANMKVYDVMPRHHPDLFIHIGDFTYPSYQIPDSIGYPQNWSAVELAWRRRYEEPVCKDMLRNIPMAYMPDDDDTWGNSRYNKSTPAKIRYENGKLINYFDLIPRTPEMRTNCLQGYKINFPGYPIVNDTDGYYHSFKVGNCEFFMLDVRSCNTGGWNSLEYNSALNWWTFNDHNPHLSMLNEPQLDWFLNAIKNSTATWKFIMSGVPFNQNIQKLISLPLLLQGVNFDIANQSGTGFRVSSSFADYWGSYPIERNKILHFIKDNAIQNVIVVSGDTHGYAIDDGRNAGLPELNASGLSVSSTELYFQFNNVLSTFGFDLKKWLWNQGGMGIGNDDTKNAFGQMEVFGNDSVQLCIYDEDDIRIACYTVKNSDIASGVQYQSNNDAQLEIFPNPAHQQLSVKVNFTDPAETISMIHIYDLSGKLVLSTPNKSIQQFINIQGIPIGLYAISIITNKRTLTDLFVKN
jgi:phosphodiesterase/alkaline phosphatase D-like protein